MQRRPLRCCSGHVTGLLRSAGVPLAALAGHRDLCTTALVTTSARLGGLVRGYTHRGHSTLCWCRRFFSETTAPLHPGDGDAEEVELDGLEEDENEGGPGASTTDEEEMNEDASRASALLREVYGPHAKLVLQTARVRRRRDAPAEDGTETTPPPVMYRAASTFKLLGFPVELASVMGPDKAAVVDHCLNLSLRSDIPFIDPRKKPPDTRNVGRGRGGRGGRRHQHQGSNNPFVLTPHEMELKAIIDELRQLCIHFSRRLKFSMKEPVTSATVSLSTSIAPSAEELEAAELQRSRSKWTEGQQAPLFPTGVGGGAAGERTNGKADQQLFRCRVYQKDEWSVVARSMFVLESVGPTPHQALLRCMVQLRERFQQEVNDPVHMLEGVHECMALVAHLGKQIHVETVPEQEEKRQNLNKKGNAASAPSNQTQQDLSCSKGSEDSAEAPSETASADNEGSEGEEEADPPRSLAEPDLSLPPVGLTTYTTTVVVKDRYGNVTETKLRRQRSRQVAYQNISQALMKSEMPLLPSAHRLSDGISHSSAAPLLPRIKWQVALFRHRIAQHIGAHPDDIVTVCVRGVSEQQQQQQQQAEEVEEGEIVEPSASGGSGGGSPHRRGQHRDLLFTAVVTVNGDNVIFQAGGSGRYRLALDAHVCALRHLFDQYPDVCALLNQELRLTETLSLFPSKQLLDEALREHDDFPILTQHKGKWNCFAVLGTLTSSLIGSYFQTTYQSAHNAKYWWAILTINTGDCADELLLQRSAKMKGEAWKRACVEALRENFPRQHAEVVRVHPDVDLSHDILAKSSKYRSLPREKRVEHIPNLFAMVCAFAEEDLGWYQPRIRFRNTSMELGFPQWVAELEATVEDDQERRIVAVSPPYPQNRIAKRMLIWRLAQQYFPQELEFYKRLKRGDSADPTADDTVERQNKWYKPNEGIGFMDQLFKLMERDHNSMLPFSWTLKGMSKAPRRGDDEDGEGDDNIIAGECTYLGDGETPERLLQPLNVQYEAAVLGNHGDLLIADYRGKRILTNDVSSSFGRREESAVEVLMTALKTASHHLCKADSEAMWTEFETHEPPPVPSSRELCLHLFYALWGNRQYSNVLASVVGGGAEEKLEDGRKPKGTAAGSNSSAPGVIVAAHAQQSEPLVDVHAVKVGDQWVATVILPASGSLPIARAYGSTKKKSVKDALTLATRQCFPNILHYWMKNLPSASELAKEILTEPVVSELPEAIVGDVRRQLKAEKRVQHPFQLLLTYLHRQFVGTKQIRVERSKAAGNEHQCRLYLQPKKLVAQKGMTQLVGYGAALSHEEAFHKASCMALENLFDEKYPEDAH